ncbi:MAG: thiol-activated cytolysin family protein [Trueperaceae bacterium]|nr:thiol-activated cytolysin family protein [Trueperaceae bacterium]
MNQRQTNFFQTFKGLFCLLGLLGSLVSCSQSASVSTPNAYLNSLGAWDSFAPPVEATPTDTPEAREQGVKAGETKPLDASDPLFNPNYSCTTTRYTLAKNPEAIVTMAPEAGVLIPGLILQGASYKLGSLQELPIRQRAPIKITIDSFATSDQSFIEVENPSPATLQDKVRELIQKTESSSFVPGTDVSYRKTVSYSKEQMALGLDLNAKYLGASVDASLDYKTGSTKRTVTAYFIQKAFTITVEEPQTAAEFFSSDFTQAKLQEQIDRGAIGPDNLPTFVSSVTYGRIMMFSFTSSASVKDIKASLDFAYNGGAFSGEVNADAKYKNILKNSEVKFVQVGGPASGAFNLIKSLEDNPDGSSYNLAEFFEGDVSLTTFKPISYTLKQLGGNFPVAKVGDTTTYDLLECNPVSNLPQPDHWWQGEGNAKDLGDVTTFENNLEYGAGKYGQAFAMNGDNSYFAGYKPEPTVFDSTAPYTISAWINPRSNSQFSVFIAETGPFQSAGQFVLGMIKVGASGNSLFFYRRPNSGSSSSDLLITPLSSKDAAPANVWTLVTAVYGNAGVGENNIRLFVNGEKVKTAVGQGNFPTDGFVTSDQRTRFGNAGYRKSDVSYSYPFNGLMDEVMTFNRALSDEEVKTMYEDFKGYKE